MGVSATLTGLTILTLGFAAAVVQGSRDSSAKTPTSRAAPAVDNLRQCSELARRLDALRETRLLRPGTTAVLAVDARTGRVLYAAQADRLLVPASNVKLVSTATALAVLGPRWRYVTLVLGSPPDGSGRVPGDVRVVGSGDPTLDQDALERLAKRLAKGGLRRVDGDVRLGGGVVVATGNAEHEPREPEVSAFAKAFDEAGIEVSGAVRRERRGWSSPQADAEARELLRHRSKPLRQLIRRINRPSDNDLAEAVVRTAGAVLWGGRPTRRKALRAMRWWLRTRAGLRSTRLAIADGSGLSRRSRMTARQLTWILRVVLGYAGTFPGQHRQVAAYQASLPVAGRTGTLRARFRRSPVASRVIAKTGTLRGVVTISGVLNRKREGPVIFSILTNGIQHSDRFRVRRAHERIVEALDRSGCAPRPTRPAR